MRRWLDDDSLDDGHPFTFELYPWHSKKVTGSRRPQPDIIESMVFEPISEMGVRHVFAFGAPWFHVLDSLGLRRPTSPRCWVLSDYTKGLCGRGPLGARVHPNESGSL